MLKVFKYPLEVTDDQVVKMPKLCTPLALMTQRDTPCVWALVNTRDELQEVKFKMFGTGHEVKDILGYTYLGSFKMHQDMLIFHVWYQQ